MEGAPMVFEERDGVVILRRATLVESTAGAGIPWRITPPLTLEEEEEGMARAIGEAGAQLE